MESIKKYYGADASDKVLPWIFYRIVEAEHSNPDNEIKFIEISDNE